MSTFIPAELIKKKKRGESHTREELKFIVDEFVAHRLPKYQMSAWLMAVCFQGMSDEETALFTQIMRDSGQVLNFSTLSRPVIDKHSTGGVGDKTSLVVGPIAAAAGVPIAMIAGRGLGHTGGTLDKLESIPGFSIRLSLSEFTRRVLEDGIAIMGQSAEICPADQGIYALRDVTGTIDSLPLICSSIMSKKLAEGLGGLVLDVKFGNGAFMKTLHQARQLAENLRAIGQKHGLKVAVLLSNMNQPLGQFIGNSLEVEECLRILKGETSPYFDDTINLCIELSAHMILMGNRAHSLEEGRQKAHEILNNGHAWRVFSVLCQRQGGKGFERLPKAKYTMDLLAESPGHVMEMNTETIGMSATLIGAGRLSAEDKINPSAGIECLVKVGSKVEKGDLMFRFYGDHREQLKEASERVRSSLVFSSLPVERPTLIVETIANDSFGGTKMSDE